MPYQSIVLAYADCYHVPAWVIYSVMREESDFVVSAHSDAGACGLMQLMPKTFEWIAQRLSLPIVDHAIYDPEINIRCGTYYLAHLYERFGDWDVVFAAYNAGPTRVLEWLRNDGSLRRIPFPETKQYVARVKRSAAIYKFFFVLKGK